MIKQSFDYLFELFKFFMSSELTTMKKFHGKKGLFYCFWTVFIGMKNLEYKEWDQNRIH